MNHHSKYKNQNHNEQNIENDPCLLGVEKHFLVGHKKH